MTILLPILAVAYVASCVWLIVRIVNRKERWAKWTLGITILLMVYPMSFGPACGIVSRCDPNVDGMLALPDFYEPIGWLWVHSGKAGRNAIQVYGKSLMARGRVVCLPIGPSGSQRYVGIYGR